MKRTVTLFLILAMLFSMAPWSLTVEASAAVEETTVPATATPTVVDSGTCGENLTWIYDTTQTLTISGTGAMDGFYYDQSTTSYYKQPWSELVIGHVVIEDGVTSIGSNAFANKYISSISIGNDVKIIDGSAFANNYLLLEVVLPDSVTTIGSGAFSGCYNLKNINIPDGVTTIGSYAFSGCYGLTAIEIPNGVTSIDSSAFYGCSGLTEVIIPNSVVRIDAYAFYNCTELMKASLPYNLAYIGIDAFEGCKSLKDVYYNATIDWWNEIKISTGNECVLSATIHCADNNPEGIQRNDFVDGGDCGENLTWTLDKNGILTISGTGPMYDYEHPIYTGWWPRYCLYDVGQEYLYIREIIIEEGTTKVGANAFNYCETVHKVTLPNSLREIGASAFEECYGVREFILPDGLISIGERAFGLCFSLEQIVIPESITTIDAGMFSSCYQLTSVTIGDSVTSIADGAFNACEGLTDVYYGGTETQWNMISIVDDNNYLTNATIHYNSTGPVEIIDSGKCGTNVTWVLSNDGTLTISGTGPMTDYDSLDIDAAPWRVYKDSVKKAVVNSGVTAIGDFAFAFCDKLTSVTIPDSVTDVGYGAFYGTKNLTQIQIDPGNSAYCSDEDGVLFNKDKTVLIRANLSIDGDYSVPEGVKSFAYGAFADCTNLVSVVIPDSVTGIGERIFSNCSNMTDITIPVSVSKIWTGSFVGCDSLTDVYYVGTQAQWSQIEISAYNDLLTKVAFHYECYEPVTIQKQPVPAETVAGEIGTVSFTAKGTGLTYQWYYKDKGASEFTLSTDFTGDSYNAVLDENSDGREVYCVVTDWQGNSVTTDTVTLRIIVPVFISQQPVSVAVPYGETATVSFLAQGEDLTYKWYYKDVGVSKFSLTATFTGNTYSAVINSYRDGRQVYCVVTDRYGNSVTTDTVTLSVAEQPALSITKQPVSVTVAEGETATVTFTAQGEGLTYQWYYRNKGATKFSATATFKGNTYTAEMNTSRAGRQIYCVVTDQYGNSVQTDTVTLNMLSKSVVKITQQPVSVEVPEGEMATVTFTAEGEGLTYQWYYKNKGASKFSATATFKGNTYTAEMNYSRAGREIYCVVTDKYGNSVQTDTVTLRLADKPPVFISWQPVSVAVAGGETATVSFLAEGEGLTYKWYYKDVGATKFTLTTTFTGNTYFAVMNSFRDGRQVYCVVTDQYGNSVTTDTVTLSRMTPLAITKQPESVTVASGATATVTFTATGDGLTYKWYYKDKGVNKFSLTTTFTGTEYSAVINSYRDGRQIYCVVTDQYGNSVTTDTVTLSRY